jgi:hypothetical protein
MYPRRYVRKIWDIQQRILPGRFSELLCIMAKTVFFSPVSGKSLRRLAVLVLG